ncbi:MAG TPA: hypothetical protein VJ866_01475 [Pyrinomonadaceae bacterium]|nr:hypothetical protein [Pyrinomonadaceae bacterium]
MLTRTLLTLALLLTLITLCAGQTPTPAAQPDADAEAARQEEAAALAQRRAALLADLRALESESKELLRPLEAASARAEIAAAAWPLERDWAKSLLREALALTLPPESERERLRSIPVGGQLDSPSPEAIARSMIRSRVLKLASAEPEFARELAAATAAELGREQESAQYTQLASAAVGEGRLEEAADLVGRAIDAEPTLINISLTINEVAARDRAAGDRLALRYVEALRALPLSAFAGQGGMNVRVPLNFMWILRPDAAALPGAARPSPAGREVVRAFLNFVLETAARVEQSHGDLGPLHAMLAMLLPLAVEHAPELTAQFVSLERASRGPNSPAPALTTLNATKAAADKMYEERMKLARQSKDPLELEVAVSFAAGKKEFEEARKLLSLMKDGETKTRLGEMLDIRESQHLTETGDLTGAERLARQLTGATAVLQAYPPLVKRLAKQGDAGRAALLVDEAVRRLRESAEKDNSNDSFIPTALASVASSLRVFKQTRALLAMSELAIAVAPADTSAALDTLDALVETASKARVTSENGQPNFNAEAFAVLSAADDGRVRSAAGRLEDRVQRIAALAAVYRAEAARLEKDAAQFEKDTRPEKKTEKKPAPAPQKL